MKVKKDSVQNKVGNKPLTLNVINDSSGSSNVPDSSTPLLFDPNDPSNADFADMMQYSTMPFFPTSMYPYGGNYQGQYPGLTMDPEMFESMFNNPLFSPDGSLGNGDETDMEQTAAVPTSMPSSQSTLQPNAPPPNLENYSLTVKVRHPDKTAKVIKGNKILPVHGKFTITCQVV